MDTAVQEANELIEVEEVQVFLLEQELAMNNYRISGEEEFLVEYEQSEHLADLYLRQAIIDASSAEERDALNLLSQEKETFNRAFDEVLQLHEHGELAKAQLLAEELAEIQEERVQQMHDQVERFAYKGGLTLQEAVEKADNQTKQVIVVGVVSLLLFSGLAIIASLTTNQVAEPILHLTNAAIAFENDTYEPDLLQTYFKRREEMGQLAHAFVHTAEEIEARRERLENEIEQTRQKIQRT